MTTDNLYDALERIAATSSKKEKLAIVQTLGEHREWLRRALDPTVAYGFTELPAYTAFHGTEYLGDADRELLDKLASGDLAGSAAENAIAYRMRFLTPPSQEVLRRVILKDLRAGIGDTTVNAAFPGLIPVFPYMRCVLPKDSTMDEWDWTQGIYVQLKADGMFANVDIDEAGRIVISSRQGKPFPSSSGAFAPLTLEMVARLRWGTRTMGELTVYQDGQLLERQIGNGILNKLAQGGVLERGQVIHFDAWDQIPLEAAVYKGKYSVPYSKRFHDLSVQLLEGGEQVHLIPTTIVYSKAEAFRVYRTYLSQKLEGVICKHPQAIWKDGDNADQVKLKLEVVVDLRIKGFREGTAGKRTAETFGSLVCETADGLLEVGVSGFKRDTEQFLHKNRDAALGWIVAVKANGVMEPTGEEKIFSLFSPRFAELRMDKTEADTLEQVQAQFEEAIS